MYIYNKTQPPKWTVVFFYTLTYTKPRSYTDNTRGRLLQIGTYLQNNQASYLRTTSICFVHSSRNFTKTVPDVPSALL